MPQNKVVVVNKSQKDKKLETRMKQIAYSQAQKAQKAASELKFYISNTFAGGTASSTTAGIADVATVPQSAGASTDQSRVGDELYLRSFQIRYAFIAADAYNICRLIVFQWHQDDSPLADDILADITYGVMSPYRKDTKGHYTILMDNVHVVDTNNPAEYRKKFISRGFKKKIRYDAGSTTGQNKIFFLHVSDSSAVTHPSLRIETQINFMDA